MMLTRRIPSLRFGSPYSRGGLPAESFDPTALTGFKAWYDGSYLASLWQNSAGSTPVASLNDPIGRWDARAGASAPYWSIATSSLRPLYKAVGVGTGVKFDGSDDYLQCSSATFFDFLHQSAGGTILVVCAFNASDSGSIQCLYDSTNSDNNQYGYSLQIRDDSTNQGRLYGWVGKPTTSVWFFSDGTNRSHGTELLTIDVAHKYGVSGNDGVANWNGTDVVTAESSAAPGSSSSAATPRIGLTTGGARPLAMSIRHLIFCEGQLPSVERTAFRTWGLTQ